MKILVGYEETEAAQKALDLAVKQAGIFKAKLFVITSRVGGGALNEDIEDYKRVEDSLETVGRRLAKEPIEFETRLLVRGFKPGEDIVTFAKENEVDQIVIGIKRKSKVGKMLFGSNAQYVILNAHCPVLTT